MTNKRNTRQSNQVLKTDLGQTNIMVLMCIIVDHKPKLKETTKKYIGIDGVHAEISSWCYVRTAPKNVCKNIIWLELCRNSDWGL